MAHVLVALLVRLRRDHAKVLISYYYLSYSFVQGIQFLSYFKIATSAHNVT